MTRNDLADTGPHTHHRAAVQYFALLMGLVFLIVGVLGFVPGANVMHHHMGHDLTVTTAEGQLMGLFPVNVLHNLVHVLFGLWGLIAFARLSASRIYARSVAVIYAVFVVMGLIPALNTVFGLVPLYGNDVWLHALIVVAAAFFGFAFADATDAGHGHGATPHHA